MHGKGISLRISRVISKFASPLNCVAEIMLAFPVEMQTVLHIPQRLWAQNPFPIWNFRVIFHKTDLSDGMFDANLQQAHHSFGDIQMKGCGLSIVLMPAKSTA